jgi:hypothetical protein
MAYGLLKTTKQRMEGNGEKEGFCERYEIQEYEG